MSVFLAPSAETVPKSIWKTLVGADPEQAISQPRTGGTQEVGAFEVGQLLVVTEPTRIDIVYTADPKLELPATGLRNVGTLDEALTVFTKTVAKWFDLDISPAAGRVAFGVILHQPATDRIAGYRKVGEYLPAIKLDAEGSSDFVYQINRPRASKSGVVGLKVNRLSKWSVALFQTGRLQLAPGASSFVETKFYHGCRLELDINTVPDFQGELSKTQQAKVFSELVELGKEIAVQGDVA